MFLKENKTEKEKKLNSGKWGQPSEVMHIDSESATTSTNSSKSLTHPSAPNGRKWTQNEEREVAQQFKSVSQIKNEWKLESVLLAAINQKGTELFPQLSF